MSREASMAAGASMGEREMHGNKHTKAVTGKKAKKPTRQGNRKPTNAKNAQQEKKNSHRKGQNGKTHPAKAEQKPQTLQDKRGRGREGTKEDAKPVSALEDGCVRTRPLRYTDGTHSIGPTGATGNRNGNGVD